MAAPVEGAGGPVVPVASVARRSRRRQVLLVLLAVVVVVELVVAVPPLSRALAELSVVRVSGLAAAVALTAASFTAFALARRTLLAAAGSRLPVADVLGGVLVANALHNTAPLGSAVSTTYAYRWARTRQVEPAVAVWQLVAGGMLATATLAVLAAAGALLLGTGGSARSLPLALLPLVAFVAVSQVLARHAPAGVGRLTRWIGRGGPRRQALATRLEQAATDLAAVRPPARTWPAATAWTSVNWLCDLGCLVACLSATGVALPAAGALVLAYTGGMAASGLSLLPFGIGTVDVALVGGLVAAGVEAPHALSAVVLYRLVAVGIPVAVGLVLGGKELRQGEVVPDPGPAA